MRFVMLSGADRNALEREAKAAFKARDDALKAYEQANESAASYEQRHAAGEEPGRTGGSYEQQARREREKRSVAWHRATAAGRRGERLTAIVARFDAAAAPREEVDRG